MEDLYIVQEEEFSVTRYMCRMLRKDYDCKGSVEKKKSGHESQGARCQGELIGGNLQVIK
jgi:muramoyltetrapeptide carboxypeptidase LdcA involved in peptidoglycan recycling